ncbi:MAG: MFS transporter [Chlorobiaceae bacterium]|nr:MFS transporter [Chlorobiaceae bacterium]MBA4310759.1 MFS transporter [Chlorobiaceae bacterium]
MLNIQKKLSNSFYLILSLPATAMGFALSIQISALSWLLSTQFNLDIHEIGFVWAAGPLAGIFGQVIVGLISDKVWFWNGRRRPFILIGGTIAAFMLFALPNLDLISNTLSFLSIVIVATMVALTLDLAINISFNPTRALIADVTPEGNKRTKGYTWMQSVSGFFGVMAYVIGATFGNYFLIYFGIILVLLFSVVPIFFIKEPKNFQVDEVQDEVIRTETQWSELIKLFIAHGFSWLGVQTMFVYIIAFIQQKLNPVSDAATGQMIAISFAVLNTVGFLLPALVLEPISQKLGRVKTHLFAVAIMSIGYFSIVMFGHSSINLYISMAIVGIGWAAIVSLPFAIMSEKVDKSRMGFFMGIFNLSVVIPQLIVSLFFGLIIQAAVDKNIIFIISGSMLAISALFWKFVKEK